MAAPWPQSRQMCIDNSGAVSPGALAYFFLAGTTTPLTTYQDAGLATPHTHPVEADGNGRWPRVFFDDDAVFDERVIDGGGTQLWYDLAIESAPAEPAPGGGSSVEAADLLDVGDTVWRPQVGTRNGWVRCNGLTIGSGASGGTERANDDCEDLFLFLHTNLADSVCPVSGGRGASAAADWAANKTIGTIDMRGLAPYGVDDMGNSLAGRLAGTTFAVGTRQTAGARGGADTRTIAQANLPNVNLSSASLAATANTTNLISYSNSAGFAGGGTSALIPGGGVIAPEVAVSISGSVPLGGSGTALQSLSPAILGTWYMKLRRETA